MKKKISFYSKLFRKCWGGTNTINLHTASKSLNHSLKAKEMNNQKNHWKIKEKGERTRAFWAATSSTSEENPRIHLECCKSSASSRPLLSSLHLTPPPPLLYPFSPSLDWLRLRPLIDESLPFKELTDKAPWHPLKTMDLSIPFAWREREKGGRGQHSRKSYLLLLFYYICLHRRKQADNTDGKIAPRFTYCQFKSSRVQTDGVLACYCCYCRVAVCYYCDRVCHWSFVAREPRLETISFIVK